MTRIIRILLGLCFCFVVSTTIYLGYGIYFSNSSSNKKIIFDVAPGDTFNKVSDKLVSTNLIDNKNLFLIYIKVFGFEKKLKVGEFELFYNMSIHEIVRTLVSNNSFARKITIQEGLNMYEIAQILADNQLADKDKFLDLCEDTEFIKALLDESLESLEGYLFPETYKISKYTSEETIISAMVRGFLDRFNIITPRYNKYIKNRNDAIIMASIIEKETGVSYERPTIASVFYNRFNLGMRLQSDPTIIYGILKATGVQIKNIRRSDIKSKNEYNTYHIRGLPKTPIANPGEDAIRAVFSPAKTKYLYFVSKNDGSHQFSLNYEEHKKAVDLYQKKIN